MKPLLPRHLPFGMSLTLEPHVETDSSFSNPKQTEMLAGGFLPGEGGREPGRACVGETGEEEVLGPRRLVLQLHLSQDSERRQRGLPMLPLAGG